MSSKYRPFTATALPDRRWPEGRITQAPVWCSVDLRDGNQALIEPMGSERKTRMFDELQAMGFKEIEVGFPAASQTDFDFTRQLIEKDSIEEGVTIQILTQARAALIERSFEAIRGARRAIVHFYNSTSETQRRVVFRQDRAGVIDIARKGAEHIRSLAEAQGETDIVYQYSPESYTATEQDFALEICEAVADVFEPDALHKLIVNLPATVELSTPNLYADMIEHFCRNFSRRESIVVSLHPHNDRGTAVAASELGLMAGAERIEGTLFGNGERTGNVDVITLALNMLTQGVDPRLSISDINRLRRLSEYCTQIPVGARHPYAGDLVFTAFSGSHQDAIAKGFSAMRQSNAPLWDVPYLPIDPQDIGRNYQALIRINSQSGKGGIAYVMKNDYGFELPRPLQIAFSNEVQKCTDKEGGEITSDNLFSLFEKTYMNQEHPMRYISHRSRDLSEEQRHLSLTISLEGKQQTLEHAGNGPIDAAMQALLKTTGLSLRLVDYHQHAITQGADAQGASYIALSSAEGEQIFGVGLHTNVIVSSLKALVAAFNAALAQREQKDTQKDKPIGEDARG